MYRPEMVMNERWLKYVGDIESAKEVVQLINLAVDWQIKLKDQAILIAIENGLKIDGLRVSQSLIRKVVEDDPGREESIDVVAGRLGLMEEKWKIQTIKNYIQARKYVAQLINLGTAESEGQVAKELGRIQGLLMERLMAADSLGEIRSGNVDERWSRDWWKQPVAIEVSYQLEDVWRWWKSDEAKQIYSPVAIAVLAYELLRIRPMAAANGRTVLLLVWLLLSSKGYYCNGWYALEEYMDWSSMGQGDLSLWVEDFLANLSRAMVTVKESAKRLSGGEVKYRDKSDTGGVINSRQRILMELLKMKGKVTMAMAREALPGISDDTIWREFKMLLKKKLVLKRGTTRSTVYVLKKKG